MVVEGNVEIIIKGRTYTYTFDGHELVDMFLAEAADQGRDPAKLLVRLADLGSFTADRYPGDPEVRLIFDSIGLDTDTAEHIT
ncbi:MAG: hypothetical protein BWY68_00530 [bacterium ADurb.Bin400]|nr:MAG: hypothetical protein BWY68_00530 [bacterium ADurb.Bin400]